MSEHNQLTQDDATSSPAHHQAPSADGPGEAPADIENAPPDASRKKHLAALLAAVAGTVFGSRLIVISTLGSPVPLLDQWPAEAARLYSPYLKGALSFADLFAPHNEHRIFVFRLLALLHLELAGEWNTRLEMILGAIVLTAVITWLAGLLMPLVAPQHRLLLACFIVFVFALPIGYENALWGFQAQVYLTLLFGIAALVAFASAHPFSLRWFGGLITAVLSYLSFATGAATMLAAGVLVGLQLVTNARKRCRAESAAFVVMAAIAAAMILWAALGAGPPTTPWSIIQGLVLYMCRIIPAAIPAVWFCLHTAARRPAISDRAWVAVGIAGWVAIQIALLAYGRGNLVAPRYMDILLLIYPVGLVAVFAFADGALASRSRRYAGAAAGVFALAGAIATLSTWGTMGAIDWNNSARHQAANLQAYLATENLTLLQPKGHGLDVQLYYENPRQLANILRDPDVRAILPPEFRPAGADNAGARNRMWLKGILASGTATAVRGLLAIGPALLGLGVSLFFAAGARRVSESPR